MSVAAFEAWLEADADSTLPPLDVPFLPGHSVRLTERPAFRWPTDRGVKRFFRVWIDKRDHSAVLHHVTDGVIRLTCSDHDNYCDCKRVVAAYCITDPRS
jgi:hypothetical protein